jgi:hypothetical protein
MQIPANVQIVNMTRPGGSQSQNQQKIVLSPQIVGNRPQNPGVSFSENLTIFTDYFI